ncbi:MAG: DegT/DnrJ/EryC1/StrS family aminotransferase [Anaerolineae bacterium]
MVTKIPFVDLKAQYAGIRTEVNEAIAQVLEHTDFVLGQSVSLFENEFAQYCEAKVAVGVDSGTSALEMALRAYHVGPGDEVITAANTFIATALAISYTGATPVFVDIDPETHTIDPKQIERAITDRTKAIIPVHLYGQPADMDPIMEIAHHYEMVVIEDACQAHGARYKGRRTGSLGHAAAFSFYPSKNLGAFGDGGMVVTNDEEAAASIAMMRNYGQKEKYRHVLRGYNRRLDTLQAAVLRVKLQHLDAWNAARREHAKTYRQVLEGLPVILPADAVYAESVYHLYVVRAQDRDALCQELGRRGVSCGVHYPVPIHLQEAYRDLGYGPGSFPITERDAQQILSLPMYAELTADQIAYVAGAIAEATPDTARESARETLHGELVPGVAGG